MSPREGLPPARVIALVHPVTWQPAPDRRIPDVRDVTAAAPPGNTACTRAAIRGLCVRDVTTAAPPGNAIGRPHTFTAGQWDNARGTATAP